ncbi:hypothetical protein [Methylophaga pinxianii]|uniref:hypothetical protein n=1 Tax=Methylophaga pinxianii TaxID=2881052 RepID=UPI001CF4995B|nr:hypothetical protein [Methylophaga pinxianii]MCB2425882.1 hypothetical protein [Methylophaga pinxianii]UPH45122.1 hypothetical protein LGT42_011460 [Methylophaga pinxianii]
MKKAMLFFAALLFSVNASAATLTLVGDAANAGTVGISSGQVVTANWSSSVGGGETVDDKYTLTTDVTSGGYLSLTFNTLADNTSVSVFDGVNTVEPTIMSIASLGVVDYFWVLQAATDYVISIFIESANAGSNYDLRVETPIPAALWLFAPALMGFFGLRRRAQVAAA